jgi:hypothetical protein
MVGMRTSSVLGSLSWYHTTGDAPYVITALGVEDRKVWEGQFQVSNLICKQTDCSTWGDLEHSGLAEITDEQIPLLKQSFQTDLA